MTMIHDLEAPAVEAEPRRQEQARTRNRLVALVGISALVLTAVNLVVSARLYSTASHMAALGARLEQMASFEKRITDKLDLVNVGLQGQFDRLDDSVASRFTEASEGIGALKRDLAQLTGKTEDGAPSTQWTTVSVSGPAPQEQALAADIGAPAASDQHGNATVAMPSLSPAYQRIETPEGKVTYRKVK